MTVGFILLAPDGLRNIEVKKKRISCRHGEDVWSVARAREGKDGWGVRQNLLLPLSLFYAMLYILFFAAGYKDCLVEKCYE